MRFLQISGTAAMLCASIFLSSCATTGKGNSKVSITQTADKYEGQPSAVVANDIKTILVAGGLNATNPAGNNTGRPVELASSNNKAEIDQLIASLSSPGGKPPISAAIPGAVEMASARPPVANVPNLPSPATAMVEEDTETVDTFRFPPIEPNIKNGTAAVQAPVTVPSNIQGQLFDSSRFAQAPIQKTARKKIVKSAANYSKPSVKRF